MNKKYERYIEYIVSDIKPPYFENMKEMYGVSEKEYSLVLSKVFNQPVTIKGDYEDSNGRIYDYYRVYDTNGNKIYYENSNGFWKKYEYDNNYNKIYYEDSNGRIYDYR